jgi:thiamine-phosphate pyrophosphorylase
MASAELQARLRDARLYLCTDARRAQGDLEQFLDAAVSGGVDVVQLRDKSLEAREEIETAEVFAAVARRHGALFSINDRADVAWVVRPDILHLGQGDLPVPAARAIVGDDMLIGRSSHAPHEVDLASTADGVDYFCVGPVWPTPTKPGRSAPGLPLVRYASGCASDRPWFAIGGIGLDNIDDVLAAGADRVVVVRAITEADDPAAAAAALAAKLPR